MCKKCAKQKPPLLTGEASAGSSGLCFCCFGFGSRRLCGIQRGQLGRPCPFRRADIDRRVEGIVILCVQVLLHNTQRIAETLEMHNFTRTQELERLAHIRVVDQAQQIVVGCAGFLFCCDGARTTFLEAVIFIVQTAFK